MLKENMLIGRDDLRRSLIDLLEPLKTRVVPGGYFLGCSGTHYDPKVAMMEGFCRTLWGIGPLIAGGGNYRDIDVVLSILKEGTDPACDGYWGIAGNRDQRLVEMAPIALSLMIAKKKLWEPLSHDEKNNLYRWLSVIERCELPPNNWNFFRILVCACFRELDLPVDEKAEKESFDIIESVYRADGWYQDGPEGNFDLYNPMAFHYYGLIWAKLAGTQNRQRAERYLERAQIFASRYTSWFTSDGEGIPYGRSLCYRFAASSFFSACAFADLPVLPWGALKGYLLRSLRHWFSLPILDSGGILSIGCGYQNLVMSDRYNSPGSPYWGLKAWLVLAIGQDHPFWVSEEEADLLPETADKNKILTEKVPGFVMCKNSEDAQIFTAGKFLSGFEMNNAAAKYGKFVYSAKAGFCVSLGNYSLEAVSCDSSLVLSDGGSYWRERRNVSNVRTGEPNEEYGWVSSLWQPWPDVDVTTILVCLGVWHIRIHRIKSQRILQAAEGGFSVQKYLMPRSDSGYFRNEKKLLNLKSKNTITSENAQDKKVYEAHVSFPWGMSRIIALEENSMRKGTTLTPAPNLNVLHPFAAIPVLEGKIEKGATVWITAACRVGNQKSIGSHPAVKAADNGSFVISHNNRQILLECF